MALTLANIRATLQGMIGDRTSETETLLDRFINMAGADVWSAYEWPERWGESWLTTLAPYDTGTVDLTKASPNVTGNGTVFPAAAATTPYRLALSYTDAWYTVKTRTSDTALVLDENYSAETAAATDYVLYANKYSLGATVETIRHILLMESGYTNPHALTRRRLDEIAALGNTIGAPMNWAFDGLDASGYLTIRLQPIPDEVYRILVRYLTAYTVLVNDGDTPVLVERRRDLIIERALWHAYRLRSEPAKAADQLILYKRRLGEAISDEPPVGTAPSFRRFDDQLTGYWINYNFPAVEA